MENLTSDYNADSSNKKKLYKKKEEQKQFYE